jgi:hypothetical protein
MESSIDQHPDKYNPYADKTDTLIHLYQYSILTYSLTWTLNDQLTST